jgi:hypothetical protein
MILTSLFGYLEWGRDNQQFLPQAVGFMFLIGLLGLNLRIVASTVPFIVFAIIALRLHYKK